MSTVTSVSVQSSAPTVSTPPAGWRGVTTSGTSNGGFAFFGCYTDARSNNCVIVFKAGSNRDSTKCTVDTNKDGGVFPSGTTGAYCLLFTSQTDLWNWTVKVRTDVDGAGKGVVFTGGNGGGA